MTETERSFVSSLRTGRSSCRNEPVVLLTGYRTPVAIRRIGISRLEGWLAHRKVRTVGQVTPTVVDAAKAQHTTVPGEHVAAWIVADLAVQLLSLDERISSVEHQIRVVFDAHPQAGIIESMPGRGRFSAPN